MDSSDTASHILLILLFLILSAAFTMADRAFSAAQRSRLKETSDKGDRRAALALSILDAPERMTTAMLIGDTLSNVAASVLAIRLALSDGYRGPISTLIWIIAIAVIILIFGEIIPRKAGDIDPEGFIVRHAKAVNFITIVFTPLVLLVSFAARLILLLLHIKPDSRKAITEEDLRDLVDMGHEEGVIENEEKFMITNVFDFGDQTAKDIMIPRVDMTCVDVMSNYDDLIGIFRENQYTRMPVYEEDTDNIIGIINIKDILLLDNKDAFSIRDCMRKPFFTFESKKVSKLLNEMRKSSNNVAIVLSEYGSCVGMITMEDMLEEIVGDIRDEYDEDEEKNLINIKVSDKEYLVDGSMRLNDLNELMGTRLSSEDYDSVGGYITGLLSHLPDTGESVTESGLKFIVEAANDTRVEKVRIFKLDDQQES